ncbi:uncharacterized protein LOC131148346 isoform X2 [Malania oleifera]|uniref:uncharacterized protein LOC131148346 isoform X2 n=1 Tax=Malania oleifera TaxID=397392 RepID=UPI0025ADA736|nr:uncharacterized protein LOC131148346 isoform X2 [Malania oleifera]
MDPRLWHKVAAVSGIAALGLGTYGAHVFKPSNPSYKDVWHTASLYHLVHTAALLGAPFTKHPNIFGGLLTTGILAFSGTCGCEWEAMSYKVMRCNEDCQERRTR